MRYASDNKPFVYISGPYSSDPENNTKKAIEIWHKIFEYGGNPICPHLSHYLHTHRDHLSYGQWLEYDFALLEVCDLLYRFEGESPGGDKEVEHAEWLGIPVTYTLGDTAEMIGKWVPRITTQV